MTPNYCKLTAKEIQWMTQNAIDHYLTSLEARRSPTSRQWHRTRFENNISQMFGAAVREDIFANLGVPGQCDSRTLAEVRPIVERLAAEYDAIVAKVTAQRKPVEVTRPDCDQLTRHLADAVRALTAALKLRKTQTTEVGA